MRDDPRYVLHAQQPVTTTPTMNTSKAVTELTLSAVLARAGHRLLNSVPDLTRAERDFIYQMNQARYGFKALDRLCEIAARSVSAADAVGVPTAIRGHIVRQRLTHFRDVESEIALYHEETKAQSFADVAQSASLINPSRANRESSVYHTTQHIERAIQLADRQQALLAPPRTLIVVDGGLAR